jgi:SAM-dependent methyltransferase
MLDLACGTGEMLCTWARDHRVTGTGVDISTVFIGAAQVRAIELGVAGQVSFVHGDASGHVADQPVDLASCVGATWIGGGVPGAVGLLRRSLGARGTMLVGEPCWHREPPDQATVEGCHAANATPHPGQQYPPSSKSQTTSTRGSCEQSRRLFPGHLLARATRPLAVASLQLPVALLGTHRTAPGRRASSRVSPPTPVGDASQA